MQHKNQLRLALATPARLRNAISAEFGMISTLNYIDGLKRLTLPSLAADPPRLLSGWWTAWRV